MISYQNHKYNEKETPTEIWRMSLFSFVYAVF